MGNTAYFSEETFQVALDWLASGIVNKREFITLTSDLQKIDSLRASGSQAFIDAYYPEGYEPREAEYIRVPKDEKSFREVLILSLEDRVFITALLINAHPQIYQALQPFQKTVDHAHPFPPDNADDSWFARFREEYASFRKKTNEFMTSGYHLAFSDVKSFSGHCRMDLLSGQMVEAGIDAEHVSLIIDAFDKWNGTNGTKGIPQGYSFTDILMKLYLLPLDREMTADEIIVYYRYNDDLRIAAVDDVSMRQGFEKLTEGLNKIGLSLNETKTDFLNPDAPKGTQKESVRIEDYLQPCWQGVRMLWNYKEHAAWVGDLNYDKLPKPLLNSLYETYLKPQNSEKPEIPETLFNFIIRRMGKSGCVQAAKHVVPIIGEKKNRLSLMLDYLLHSGTDTLKNVEPVLKAVFSDKRAFSHDWHSRYIFIRFLGEMNNVNAASKLLEDIRQRLEVYNHDVPKFAIASFEDAVAEISAKLASVAPALDYRL